jgi:hypothetical protein
MKKITSKIKSVAVASAVKDAVGNATTYTVSIPSPLIDVPDVVEGVTIRLKGHSEHSTWLTINHIEREGKLIPIQLFLNSKDPDKFLMLQVLGTSASAIFRHGRDVSFLADEWINTTSSEPYWYKSKLYHSWVSQVGHALRDRLVTLASYTPTTENTSIWVATKEAARAYSEANVTPKCALVCKKCKSTNVVNSGSCLTCMDCGDAKCG